MNNDCRVVYFIAYNFEQRLNLLFEKYAQITFHVCYCVLIFDVIMKYNLSEC